jgi:hypothetical protein
MRKPAQWLVAYARFLPPMLASVHSSTASNTPATSATRSRPIRLRRMRPVYANARGRTGLAEGAQFHYWACGWSRR